MVNKLDYNFLYIKYIFIHLEKDKKSKSYKNNKIQNKV